MMIAGVSIGEAVSGAIVSGGTGLDGTSFGRAGSPVQTPSEPGSAAAATRVVRAPKTSATRGIGIGSRVIGADEPRAVTFGSFVA